MPPCLRSSGPVEPDEDRPPGPDRGPDDAQPQTEPDSRAPHGSILPDPATSPFTSTAAAELFNQGEHGDESAAVHQTGGSGTDAAEIASPISTCKPKRTPARPRIARRGPMASPPPGPRPANPRCSVTRGAQGPRSPAAEYAADKGGVRWIEWLGVLS